MATTVYDVVEIELRDKSVLLLKPLTIKKLRKFLDIINELGKENAENTEEKTMEVFIQAAMFCLEDIEPKLANQEAFEDIIEVPTMIKILEVVGGLKTSDPNLLGAMLVGTN